jgi:hypothetical protein
MRNISVIIRSIEEPKEQTKRLLVGISDFFRIHAAGKKKDKGGNIDEKKATRNIRV